MRRKRGKIFLRTEKKRKTISGITVALIIVLSLSLSCLMCSCGNNSEETGSEDEYDFQLSQGQEQSLDIGSDGKKIEWKSTNKNVATVSKDGRIIAGEPGETEITVKVDGKTRKYKVKIEADEEKVKDSSKENKDSGKKPKDKTEKKKKNKNNTKKSESKSKKSTKKKEKSEPQQPQNVTMPAIRTAIVDAKQGDKEVKVNVDIENNPGVLGMLLKINYDSSALTLKSASNGKAVSDALSLTSSKKLQDGCSFVWDGLDLTDDQIRDGTILNLVFDVAPNADEGKYTVTFSYDEGDIIDRDLESVKMTVIDGGINVRK